MANAFSNPALFQHFKPVQTENWETAVQLASFKRAEFDKGQEEMNQWMKALASTPIDNIQAKAHFEDRVKTALTEIDRVTTANDISNRGMREKILSSVGGIIDDTTINAISATRSRLNYDAKWEALKKEKPELYSDLNYKHGIAGYNEYINADKDADVRDFVKNRFEVVPYTNINEILNKNTMEMVKQIGKREKKIPIPDANGVIIGYRTVTEVGLSPEDLRQVTMASLNDPNVMKQIQINAWDAYGGFSEEGVNKLVQDFEDFTESRVHKLESERDFEKTLLKDITDPTKKSQAEAKIKQYDEAITTGLANKEAVLKKIQNGQYAEASSQIYAENLVSKNISKFETLYDQFQSGVEADEIYWKIQDQKLEVAKFNWQQNEAVLNREIEWEKVRLSKEANEIASLNGTGGPQNDGVIETNVSFEPKDLNSLGEILDENLVGTNEYRKSLIKGFVENIDEQLKNGGTNEIKQANDLKENYINQLYSSITKNGGKINKDYMRTLSFQELVNGYEKDKSGTILYAVARRMKSSILDLAVNGEEDFLQNIADAERTYKGHLAVKEDIENTHAKSLEKNIYTPKFLKTVMSEETNVLHNGKVVKAKEAYKNEINPDGTWRKGVSQEKKNKIIKELDRTYELQKTDFNFTGSANQVVSKLKKAGLNPDNFTFHTTDRGAVTAIPKNKNAFGSKYADLGKLNASERAILFDNPTFRTENTNLAKDDVFSNQITEGKRLADLERQQKLEKYVNSELTTSRQFSISATNSLGKPNPVGVDLARLIEVRSGNIVNMKEGTNMTMIENKDGSFTVSYHTEVLDDKNKSVPTKVSTRIERADILNNVPSLGNRLRLNNKSESKLYTYDKIGIKPIKVNLKAYVDPNDEKTINTYSKGDPILEQSLTVAGSVNYIKNSVPEVFNKFEGFKETLAQKLHAVHEDYDLEVSMNVGGTKAVIRMVRKDGGGTIAETQKSLIDGAIDAYVKQAERTPGILLNELIAKVIHNNYYKSAGLYNQRSFIELFGTPKIKEN